MTRKRQSKNSKSKAGPVKKSSASAAGEKVSFGSIRKLSVEILQNTPVYGGTAPSTCVGCPTGTTSPTYDTGTGVDM